MEYARPIFVPVVGLLKYSIVVEGLVAVPECVPLEMAQSIVTWGCMCCSRLAVILNV